MTPDAFRKIALSLPEAEEKSHFGKADFRVRNRIFATLPGDGSGVLKLTPEQQAMMCAAEPRLLAPVAGGWGRKGWTRLDLGQSDEATATSALTTAWRNVAPWKLTAQRVGTGFSPR